jgi:DNA-binding transcriptional LysR family regulator
MCWAITRPSVSTGDPGVLGVMILTVLKALPIELPIPPRPIGIVTLKNRTPSPLATLFIECARRLSKPLAAMSTARKK